MSRTTAIAFALVVPGRSEAPGIGGVKSAEGRSRPKSDRTRPPCLLASMAPSPFHILVAILIVGDSTSP